LLRLLRPTRQRNNEVVELHVVGLGGVDVFHVIHERQTMKGLFQIIAGSVVVLGGIALGVATVVSTGNVSGAVTTAGPVIALGVGIAGFSRTIVDNIKQAAK